MKQKTKQLRKLLLALPLLVYPFICLLFFVVHSVKAENKKATVQLDGINKKVPEANIEEKDINKLSLYEQAHSDSDKLGLASRLDRRYLNLDAAGNRLADTEPRVDSNYIAAIVPTIKKANHLSPEEKAQNQLDVLKHQLELAQSTPHEAPDANIPPENSEQVGRLEKVMQGLSASGNEPDSELIQLDGMLDKILKIQHPEMVGTTKDSSSSPFNRKALVNKVGRFMSDNFQGFPVDSARVGVAAQDNRFYDLDQNSATSTGAAFSAMLATNSVITDGAQIQLVLNENMVIGENMVKKGSTIYGTCKIGNQRLFITVNTILINRLVVNVSLSAYGLDGQLGINAPDATNSAPLKEGSSSLINSMDISSVDESIGAQAANAGIQTAKSLITRKMHVVKVNTVAQFPLLLVDESSKK